MHLNGRHGRPALAFKRIDDALGRLDAELAKAPFLLGDGYSLADHIVASVVTYSTYCGVKTDLHADVQRWLEIFDRHFAACFAAAVGLRPKAFARRVRFAAACRALDIQKGENLCRTAARYGYADQAHMARDFREFAGCSPSAYRRAHFSDLPGISADALVAFNA